MTPRPPDQDGVLATSRQAIRGRRRAAPRALETSDVTRVRGLALATIAGAAVLAAGILLSTDARELGVQRPLSLPHRQAGLTCASCHLEPDADAPAKAPATDEVADATCRGCHVGKRSARAGHRALAEAGRLRCVSCHNSHEHDSGLVLGPGGAARRYDVDVTPPPPRGPGEQLVPLIPAAACGQCHALSAPRDPIQRCLPQGTSSFEGVMATCFDEHRSAMSTAALTRWQLWERARASAALPPSAEDPDPEEDPAGAPALLLWLAAALAAGVATLLTARALAARRRARAVARGAARDDRREAAPMLRAPERKRLPRINQTTCIGCHACVDACPYDVLEVRRYVARVARPDDCCGLTLCEQRCPNGSLIVLDTEPDTELPGLDEDLQSVDRPGIYLAGDLTGLPLIRNAINQGAHAVQRIATSLPTRSARSGEDALYDLVIVGAGPAGISASLAAKSAGLRYVTVDQDTVAASIRSFPRGKLVFDQPLGMPHIGDLWLRESTKEELLGKWLQIIHRERLEIRERLRVTAIEDARGGPPLGHFRVIVEGQGRGEADGDGRALATRRVLLAFGRRGTPRKLGSLEAPIPSAMESHVHYSLADARSFAGQRVLVIGLGDVAMETAIALARQPGTTVTVSYRGRGFKRGKRRNADELRRLADAGRVELVFASELVTLRDREAVLEIARDDEREGPTRRGLGCDAVFVMIGNLPPWPFLERLGVRRAGSSSAEPPAASP